MNLREYLDRLRQLIDSLESIRLPAFLDGVPRILLVLAAPLIVFLVVVGLSFGTSSNGDDERASAPPTLSAAVSNTQTLPTPVPETPTPVPAENRKDCNKIRGTAYLSEDEAKWYRENCLSPASAGASGGTGGGTGSAPAAVTTAQTPMGWRLVIPRAGVNADIWRTRVVGGYMADPWGYDNALSYDFDTPGLGGDFEVGNFVLAGHVDCGRCRNGGSGTAVFWSARNLVQGDSAQVYAAGKVVNYVVTSSQSYSPNTNWGSIVAAGAADMTIITCTGTFSGGEYNLRHVVMFRKA